MISFLARREAIPGVNKSNLGQHKRVENDAKPVSDGVNPSIGGKAKRSTRSRNASTMLILDK